MILSIGVPVFAVACAYRLEFRVNERQVSASDGLAGAFAAALRGDGATIWDKYAPRDQWWFWPAAVALTVLWLWLLWPPRARSAQAQEYAG